MKIFDFMRPEGVKIGQFLSSPSIFEGNLSLLWWIRKVTCFSIDKFSSDPSEALVGHLRIRH